MIHGLRQFVRLLHISSTLARYRLDDLLTATHLFRPMRWIRVIAPGKREIVEQAGIFGREPRGDLTCVSAAFDRPDHLVSESPYLGFSVAPDFAKCIFALERGQGRNRK